MSEFEIDTVYRAGMKNLAADALAPLKTKGNEKKTLPDEVPLLTLF